MKRILVFLIVFPLFSLFVPLAYADPSTTFNVTQINSTGALTGFHYSNTYLISTNIVSSDDTFNNSIGSCSIVDNSTSENVDTNANLYNSPGDGVIVITNIASTNSPAGWTPSSTYHMECTTIDPNYISTITSNDFHLIVNPTVVHVDQNFNLIDVYFLPQFSDYPNPNSEAGLEADFGWFDNLGGGNCESDVEYNGQNLSVCHFDLYANPNLATTDVARLSFGGQDPSNNVFYSTLSNTFHITSIQPHLISISNATITTGDTYTASGSFSNISPIETSVEGQVNYGDGSGIQEMPLDGTNFFLNHIYSTPGTYTVTACVKESLQNTGPSNGCSTATVTVLAHIQINTLSGGTITAGNTYSESGSFTDPNSGAASWTGTVDYGDGSGSHTLTLNSDKTFFLSHQYTTAGTYTVTVNVTDSEGASATGTATVTVNTNAIAPTVGQISLSASPAKINTSDTFSANFTDQNSQDTHTALWDWGDGSTTNGTVTESNGAGLISDAHTYTSLGSHTTTLTVTDSTGLSSTSQSIIAVIPTSGLAGANLSHTNYSGADFSGQNISKANLSVATFNNVDFQSANLSQVNGSNSSFTNDDFTGANLNKINFSNSNLTGSNFTNAILTQANLSNSNLTNVNFTGANLQGANLSGTTRTGITWSNTICPNGQNSNNHNNSCTGQGGGL